MVYCPHCGEEFGWKRNFKGEIDESKLIADAFSPSFGKSIRVRTGMSTCPGCEHDVPVYQEWPDHEVAGRRWVNTGGRMFTGRKRRL